MAKSKDGTSERTYLGFATTFYPRAGDSPIAPGDKVSLTDAQYAALTRAGHSFDPPWVAAPAPAPGDVPDFAGPPAQPAPADTPNQTNV